MTLLSLSPFPFLQSTTTFVVLSPHHDISLLVLSRVHATPLHHEHTESVQRGTKTCQGSHKRYEDEHEEKDGGITARECVLEDNMGDMARKGRRGMRGKV